MRKLFFVPMVCTSFQFLFEMRMEFRTCFTSSHALNAATKVQFRSSRVYMYIGYSRFDTC